MLREHLVAQEVLLRDQDPRAAGPAQELVRREEGNVDGPVRAVRAGECVHYMYIELQTPLYAPYRVSNARQTGGPPYNALIYRLYL